MSRRSRGRRRARCACRRGVVCQGRRRLQLAGDRRLAPGRRRRIHLHVREGERRHDVHGHHVSGEPGGCDRRGNAHRGVPLRAACRRERRRDRLERRSHRPTTSSMSPNRRLETCHPCSTSRRTAGFRPPMLVKWTQAWVDEVMARTGVHAIIYVSPSFWKTSLGDTTSFAGTGNPLWIAHWTKGASPLVPASNWNGLGWMFWQWSLVHRGAGLREMRRRRPSGYADRRRVRDQGLSRRLPVPQHTADDRRHGPGRKQARRRAGHLGRRQAGRLQLPVAEL